jgi:arginase
MEKINKIDIIGVPMDYGGNRRGVDMGPSAIRYSGLKKKITDMRLNYQDLGNIDVPLPEIHEGNSSKLRFLKEICSVNKKLYEKVVSSHKAGNFPLVLGGDHSLAVGSSLAGMAHYKNIGVIWIDAHADYNTSKTTVSGNLHGMPLAALTGKETDILSSFLEGSTTFVNPKNVSIIAVRDLDEAESKILKESDISVFSMQYIDLYGMSSAVSKAIEIASNGTVGFHASFDLDAVSPKEAPGVGTPVKGGLTYREAHLAMEMIADSRKMLSLDIVELNPITDHSNITGELALSLIESALGKNIF